MQFHFLTNLILLFSLTTTLTLATPYPSPISAPAARALPTFLTESIIFPGRRRGVSFNSPGLVKHFDIQGTKAKWCFNWDSRSGPTYTWFEFVPMLHDVGADRTARWVDDVKAAAGVMPGNPTHLMGFNEPDNCQ
jgi:hypothetical protein